MSGAGEPVGALPAEGGAPSPWAGDPLPAGARTLDVPFTRTGRWILLPARAPAPGASAPPLFVGLHGHGQSGARQARWMGAAVPARFAAAFPDGPLPFEVRRPGRPTRVGHGWYLFTGDRAALATQLVDIDAWLWRGIDAAAAALGADGRRVVLAGFSQGAYLTHVSAIRHRERVPAWIAQAGNLRTEYLGGALPDLSGRAVLLQQGTADDALPPETPERVAALLAGAGADVTVAWHDAGHVITEAMASEARGWLEARVPR